MTIFLSLFNFCSRPTLLVLSLKKIPCSSSPPLPLIQDNTIHRAQTIDIKGQSLERNLWNLIHRSSSFVAPSFKLPETVSLLYSTPDAVLLSQQLFSVGATISSNNVFLSHSLSMSSGQCNATRRSQTEGNCKLLLASLLLLICVPSRPDSALRLALLQLQFATYPYNSPICHGDAHKCRLSSRLSYFALQLKFSSLFIAHSIHCLPAHTATMFVHIGPS